MSTGARDDVAAVVTGGVDSVAALVRSLHERPPAVRSRQAIVPTGLALLDAVLDGGLRSQDLVLVGGRPGVGKTVVALQWARNMAAAGNPVLYACYEHDEHELLGRLLLQELGALPRAGAEGEAARVRAAVRQYATGERGIDGLLAEGIQARAVHSRLAEYAADLHLLRASGVRTSVEVLARHVAGLRDGGTPVLVVDYLQKVAAEGPSDEADRITRVAEELKELALTANIVVVAVVASDREGLTSGRLRLHHLRGSSALAYESDVVIMLNDKFDIVARDHLAYVAGGGDAFRRRTVFSVEKNRGGPAHIDVDFEKDFAYYRFDPDGRHVTERLVDGRLFTD